MALSIEQLPAECLIGSKVGLEKEGLRVTPNGYLSMTDHPSALGASLTHPCITTDFSESLLELISPPFENSLEALNFISEAEAFVHRHLDDELIWSASMPCSIENEDDIRIAEYGPSHPGMQKTIYRRGLAHRYGKQMQVIAGVHFNFSFSNELWIWLQKASSSSMGNTTAFIAERTMSAVRNAQRHDWLLLFLFGASPATSRSFSGANGRLISFDKHTLYLPYATSLRMGDMGYANSPLINREVVINHNSLTGYIDSLRSVINTPYLAYEQFDGLDGSEQQLSNTLLQTENEYYSTVRPKQVTQPGESLLNALQTRGISYVELRSIDINPFVPSGIEPAQLHFLELFMHHCLFTESPNIDNQKMETIRYNRNETAYRGRDPSLKLIHQQEKITLYHWASQLFDEMQPLAERLDQVHHTDHYLQALSHYRERLSQPHLTPSAQIIETMQEAEESFSSFALRRSQLHHQHHVALKLSDERIAFFQAVARQSYRQINILEHCKKCQVDKNSFYKEGHGTYRIQTLRCACN
ncbi:MAG: glutamate--cysteine ligase [Candidatus Thiodiazotropha sp. (ex Troendleina suluensis)]|nr:glutamate--cysteine ligase [Candidatus Thiodiazotropha sp. (ex Troendleina suluensis)]